MRLACSRSLRRSNTSIHRYPVRAPEKSLSPSCAKFHGPRKIRSSEGERKKKEERKKDSKKVDIISDHEYGGRDYEIRAAREKNPERNVGSVLPYIRGDPNEAFKSEGELKTESGHRGDFTTRAESDLRAKEKSLPAGDFYDAGHSRELFTASRRD